MPYLGIAIRSIYYTLTRAQISVELCLPTNRLKKNPTAATRAKTNQDSIRERHEICTKSPINKYFSRHFWATNEQEIIGDARRKY